MRGKFQLVTKNAHLSILFPIPLLSKIEERCNGGTDKNKHKQRNQYH